MNNKDRIIQGVNDYYSSKISQFGNTSLGVDWNSKESQYVRFKQLVKVIGADKSFSILDYGCGYGELVHFLKETYPGFKINYTGYDVSDKMIAEAQKQFALEEAIHFTTTLPVERFDYCVASGIFNVRLQLADNDAWLKYIVEILDQLQSLTIKGFSFNALTKYSDEPFMKDYLYYADPLFLFDHCKKNYSRNVALLHDYELYEFTMLIRKNG